MKYQYHDLSEIQFEDVVIAICGELLGIGVQGFAAGKDGGRDARFHGKAQCYPSSSDLWEGIIIVQAKHTNAINEKFSEPSFFNNQSSVINEEIPKIKKLIDDKSLDYYMLFSNRKLPAQANEDIINHISIKVGLEKKRIALFGIEMMERYIKKFPSIKDSIRLNPFETPLILCPDDLASIVTAFYKNKSLISQSITSNNLLKIKDIKRTSFDQKNKKNNLSADYAKTIEKDMLNHYDEITNFLSNFSNSEYKNLYDIIITEFNMAITAHRKSSDCFDKVLNYIYNLLIDRDCDLKRHKILTRIFLHYMYYFCDIGDV